jgi:hypothetical protein
MKKSLLARMGLRLRDLNWHGRELVDIYCAARAKTTTIDRWLETHDLIDESGNVAPVMKVYLAALNTSVRTLSELRSVLEAMAKQDARFDQALTALMAEGRRVRETHEP